MKHDLCHLFAKYLENGMLDTSELNWIFFNIRRLSCDHLHVVLDIFSSTDTNWKLNPNIEIFFLMLALGGTGRSN